MTDRKHSPNTSKCKSNKSIEQPKKTNERLILNKLGMKFDPVCWKKQHEKGRIQFICIEPDCHADRLGCAHCIIEDHDQHVSNKITVEQYCDTFETNYRWFLFHIQKLEENYKQCKMQEVIDIIDRDINELLLHIKNALINIRQSYVEQITQQVKKQNKTMIDLYQEQKVVASKMKDYFVKNVFEMTPAEIQHSLLLIGSKHLDFLNIQIDQFTDQNRNQTTFLKQQWKIIKQQLNSDIIEHIDTTQVNQFNFNLDENHTINDTPANLLTIYKTLESKDEPTDSKNSKKAESEELDQQQQQFGLVQQQQQSDKLNKSSSQKHINFRQQLQNIQNKEIKIVKGSSVQKFSSPLRKLSTKEISPTKNKNYFVSQLSSKPEKVAPEKVAKKHQASLSIQQTCVHDQTERTLTVFKCCNQAFPCYECHDMQCNHKAHITQPSYRLCPKCQEIFSVNLLSTVDVKCYKCT